MARCSVCGKGTIGNYRKAQQIMRRAKGERVYFCKEAGGYHITRYTRSEIDQLWATRMREGTA